jgi:hypothetical protein
MHLPLVEPVMNGKDEIEFMEWLLPLRSESSVYLKIQTVKRMGQGARM